MKIDLTWFGVFSDLLINLAAGWFGAILIVPNFSRAARLLDELEERGIVGVADGSHPRDVLIHDAEVVLGGKG